MSQCSKMQKLLDKTELQVLPDLLLLSLFLCVCVCVCVCVCMREHR